MNAVGNWSRSWRVSPRLRDYVCLWAEPGIGLGLSG